MSRVGVTAALGVLIGFVAAVVAGIVLANPGIGRPEAITGAVVGVVAFVLAMAGGHVARWASLVMASLIGGLVCWVSVWQLAAAIRATRREIRDPLELLVGVILMGVAILAGTLIARSAWRWNASPVVSVMGTLSAFLIALIGAGFLVSSVSLLRLPPGLLS